MKLLPTEEPPRRMIFHWKTYKALIAIILFLIFTMLIQWCIILYSVNLGVDDVTMIQYRFQLPNTDWTITITISPLFHIIPLVVIVTLVSSWTYLTKHIAVRHNRKQIADSKPDKRRIEKLEDRKIGRLKARIRDFTEKLKSKLMKTRSIAYLWQKIHFARATIKSALMVLSVFAAFIFYFSFAGISVALESSAYQSHCWVPVTLALLSGVLLSTNLFRVLTRMVNRPAEGP